MSCFTFSISLSIGFSNHINAVLCIANRAIINANLPSMVLTLIALVNLTEDGKLTAHIKGNTIKKVIR